MSENESRPVVVGVDGSPAARAALEWAVADARRRGCRVDAVCAWHPDYGFIIGAVPAEVVMRMSPEAMRATAEAGLEEAVGSLENADGVEIRRILVEADPRTALTDAAKDADLLVVGSRGHGTVVGLLLGSVSSYCVHHAPCPVVVVRAPADQVGDPRAQD